MDRDLQDMSLRLGELAIKTTAANVSDRISARKARRNDVETINDLEEIINELLRDKQELVRISTAMADRLQAARMSDEEITFITDTFLPKLSELAGNMGGHQGQQLAEMLDQIKPLLATETLTMMQLIGFDFRQAIGEPLTDLIHAMIVAKRPADPALGLARVEMETMYLRLIEDEDAFSRLQEWRAGNTAGG